MIDKIRRLEHFHVLLWLLKDISWMMEWKVFGMFMIVPTLGFAIFITVKHRKMMAEFFHNMAVVFWISANSLWMVLEFYEIDQQYKQFVPIPFALGFLCIASYYLIVAVKLRFRRVS